MLENALFYGKKGKIAEALEVPPPTPRWPPAVRGSASRPPTSYFRHLFQLL